MNPYGMDHLQAVHVLQPQNSAANFSIRWRAVQRNLGSAGDGSKIMLLESKFGWWNSECWIQTKKQKRPLPMSVCGCVSLFFFPGGAIAGGAIVWSTSWPVPSSFLQDLPPSTRPLERLGRCVDSLTQIGPTSLGGAQHRGTFQAGSSHLVRSSQVYWLYQRELRILNVWKSDFFVSNKSKYTGLINNLLESWKFWKRQQSCRLYWERWSTKSAWWVTAVLSSWQTRPWLEVLFLSQIHQGCTEEHTITNISRDPMIEKVYSGSTCAWTHYCAQSLEDLDIHCFKILQDTYASTVRSRLLCAKRHWTTPHLRPVSSSDIFSGS